jgi:hypothetical protein
MPNSTINNPGQIWGNPNSFVNQVIGGDHSVARQIIRLGSAFRSRLAAQKVTIIGATEKHSVAISIGYQTFFNVRLRS